MSFTNVLLSAHLIVFALACGHLVDGLLIGRPGALSGRRQQNDADNRPLTRNRELALEDVNSPPIWEDRASFARPPVKRSSIMLNRLKMALEQALDSREYIENKDLAESMASVLTSTEEPSNRLPGPQAMALTSEPQHPSPSRVTNGIRRRLVGTDDEWKCYFNVVTCF